jgi:PEP-CTERM motif
MKRAVLLALLALPTMALATTLDSLSSPDGTANLIRSVINRPAQVLGSETLLFADIFNSRETTGTLESEVPGFAVRDSYMVRAFSRADDCDDSADCDTSAVPEPNSFTLLATGLVGIAGLVGRRFYG